MLLGMSSFLVTQGARAIKGKGSMHTFYLFPSQEEAEACRQNTLQAASKDNAKASAGSTGAGGGGTTVESSSVGDSSHGISANTSFVVPPLKLAS
jgi:hypothetical protein